jgi:hypothetical protein
LSADAGGSFTSSASAASAASSVGATVSSAWSVIHAGSASASAMADRGFERRNLDIVMIPPDVERPIPALDAHFA